MRNSIGNALAHIIRSPVSIEMEGTPRKVIRGTAVVNGGGTQVVISTVNGDVTIRQRR
jgi:hypothetical protein